MQELEGQTFHGYQLGERIHQGNFADIYKGIAPNGTTVAIKIIKSHHMEDEQRKRFQREVIMMQTIKHESIVPIISFGYKDGMFYLIMPFITGSSLADLLARKRFTPRDAWEVIRPISGALQKGHERKVIHRDLKPDNILVEETDTGMRYYLADFGLAKRPGIDETLTKAGMVVGTPEYISPEMVSHSTMDHRSDIYSLAIIAYELLLGTVPFTGNIITVAMAHVKLPPPIPTEKNPAFPPALSSFLLKNLAKDKAERHPSMSDFAEAYQKILLQLSEEQQTTCYWIT
jgi:serine/threonine-protein kinase